MGIVLAERFISFNPILPPNGITKVGIRNITFHDKKFSFSYDVSKDVHITYEYAKDMKSALKVTDADGVLHTLFPGRSIDLKNNVGKTLRIERNQSAPTAHLCRVSLCT